MDQFTWMAAKKRMHQIRTQCHAVLARTRGEPLSLGEGLDKTLTERGVALNELLELDVTARSLRAELRRSRR